MKKFVALVMSLLVFFSVGSTVMALGTTQQELSRPIEPFYDYTNDTPYL